jgi:hypothetical protein
MFKKYKMVIGEVLMSLLFQATLFVYSIWVLNLWGYKEVLSSYASVFALSIITFVLIILRFSNDRKLHFNGNVMWLTVFIYGAGLLTFVISLVFYVLNGKYPVVLMWLSFGGWWLAQIELVTLTLIPNHLANRAEGK